MNLQYYHINDTFWPVPFLIQFKVKYYNLEVNNKTLKLKFVYRSLNPFKEFDLYIDLSMNTAYHSVVLSISMV